MTGPYAGLKVIELGRFIAAPFCGQLFADSGADVIKVEPIGGDDARQNGTRLSATEARQFLNKNRGKRSIALDLGDDRCRRVVGHLLENADIAITNFRPGQAEKLGIDYDAVARTNPRIIYAQNTAFGPRGPLAGKPGMDLLVQAHTGIAPIREGGPEPLSEPVADYTAALLMAWGIGAALYHREKTGRGQKLDVSLLQAILVLQNNSVNHIDSVDGWRIEFVDYLKTAFQSGKTMQQVLGHRESLKPAILPPYYGFFETSDGYIAIAAGGSGLRVKTAELLGVDDPSLRDPTFRPADISAFTTHVRAQVQARLRLRTTAEWMTMFEQAGLPAGAFRFKEEILDDEQSWANDYLVRLEHKSVGTMTAVGPAVHLSDTPLSATAASPLLGEHTHDILAEAGLGDADIQMLIRDGAVRSVQA
jgi:CoA:oxalate CoA-transferase